MEKIIGKNAKGEVKVYDVTIRNFKPDYNDLTDYEDIESAYLPNYPEVEFAKDEEGDCPDGTLVYTDKDSNVDEFVEWIKEEFDDQTKIKEFGTKYWNHEDGPIIPVDGEEAAEMEADMHIPETVVWVKVSDPTEEEMAVYKATI